MSDRDFKGVWIPKEIWLNQDLTLLEKAIYVEIDSLDNENHCTASNEYFAEFCSCSESKVSKAIKKLKDLGMIEDVLPFDGRHRRLRVAKNARQGSKKCYADWQKMLPSNIDNNTNSKKDNSNKLELSTKNSDFLQHDKPVKQSLYAQCVALINAKTEDEEVRKVLEDWLRMLLEKYKDRNKTLYKNVFKGKLNMLDNFSEEEWKDVILYNLQKGYEGFYPIRGNRKEEKPWEDGVKSINYSEQEKQDTLDWQDEMRKKGVRVDF